MNDTRRPIATRNNARAQMVAKRLSQSNITPNQISIASIGFAALAGVLFWASALSGWFGAALCLILGAVAVQGRLLCNLFDGMVAVEGGQQTPDGAFWNEAPDRLADLLILAGFGVASGNAALGLLAGALAVATAYLREFGRAEGLGTDFTGPMAKPHRMAAVTLGAVAGAGEQLFTGSTHIIWITLWLIIIGIALTILRRSRRILSAMADQNQ